MVRVIATGVFDILHPGHLHFLEEAKKLGDELIVVVARDETVRRSKHNPIMSEEVRRRMVEALKPVDKAVLGYVDDKYRIMEELKPDIIVLGYDQPFSEEEIRREMEKRGLRVSVVRLGHYNSDINGTRKIIYRIAERLERNELYGGEK